MMEFYYKNGELYCEDVPVKRIIDEVGTPAYIYSTKAFTERLKQIQEAFAEVNPLICYSVKSCSNIHILRLLAQNGAGADIVSGGELYRAITAGIPPERLSLIHI